MLERTGIPTMEQIEGAFPSEERLAQGPVVIIECFQEIPCNPCYTACKFNAMQPFEDINHLPRVDVEKCNGCGLCVTNCPGLALMVVDATYSDTEALLKIPYEFLPLPQPGQVVKGLDRSGRAICNVTVVKVVNGKAQDKTPLVSIAVPKEQMKHVRNIGWEA